MNTDRLEGTDGIGACGEEEHILGSLGRVIHYGTKLREGLLIHSVVDDFNRHDSP